MLLHLLYLLLLWLLLFFLLLILLCVVNVFCFCFLLISCSCCLALIHKLLSGDQRVSSRIMNDMYRYETWSDDQRVE